VNHTHAISLSHLSFIFRPARSRSSKSRLLLLVIPSESLTLKSDSVNYDTLESNLPQDVLDTPDDIESAKCKLLQMPFNLDKMSDVIMPDYHRRATVAQRPMVLLRKLKRLSESFCFRLFANQDGAMQDSVEEVCNMLRTTTAVTPLVHMKDLYPGNRLGCKNKWKAQAWFEQDTVHEGAVVAGKSSDTKNVLNEAPESCDVHVSY
jgi:hypothetical protein